MGKVTRWEQIIKKFDERELTPAERVDCDMLTRILTTLREQLENVGFQRTQPTFYLTIVGMGLAEALEVGHNAFARRIKSLPDFIDAAVKTLHQIPELYRDMGCEMTRKLMRWIDSFRFEDVPTAAAAEALNRLSQYLEKVHPTRDFRLSRDLYARIADRHMGCRMSLGEIERRLDLEIQETRGLLEREAEVLAPGRPWQAVLSGLPPPEPHPHGSRGTYREIIDALNRHCIDQGMISQDFGTDYPVVVETIPEYLFPVRSNAAFSMPPGHPPKGGVFYIMPEKQESRLPLDFKLLAAHETYPGHHLLDTSRWLLKRRVRQPLEFPLFYEGWASFAEEMLFDTGFFSGPTDRFLIAKRRFWRALRGRADLEIHTGQRTLAQAAAILTDNGLATADAAAMVRRYALKPGYQLAYTIGSQKFRKLYATDTGHGHTPAAFVRRILDQGEIGFDHMAKLLSGKFGGRN